MILGSGFPRNAAILVFMSSTGLTEQAWRRLSGLADQKRIKELFQNLHSRNLSSILIKGWSIVRFYDSEKFRLTSDIDLLFPDEVDIHVVEAIRGIDSTTALDAHFGPRHLDTLSFDDLFARSYEVELEGVPVRVLADEDNLRITAVHWLTDGGVNKEKLWDIFYLVKNRKAKFDWERCLDANGPIRKTWVLAAIATARDHLKLDVSGLPTEAQEFQLPDWYERTLAKEWKLGIYPRHKLSNVLTQPKLLFSQLRRRFPPNPIAATIDTETPIDNTSRLPAKFKSLTKKVTPFARGIVARLTYSIRGKG